MKNSIMAAGAQRETNVNSDMPDDRDLFYRPSLISLSPTLDNRKGQLVMNQFTDGSCTGFGLAAVINQLKQKEGDKSRVSPRMIYEMAKKHDEWAGEGYTGSSCRGAIKGWKSMGVCSEQLWPYDPKNPGALTIERAKDARKTILGAYYRLNPNLNDYHAALMETGAVFVSATIHDGWSDMKPRKHGKLEPIPWSGEKQGGHAFALVGYNEIGFIVQNSWGEKWGAAGFAIWTYEDWFQNITDGWVFRLAVSTPRVFGLTATGSKNKSAEGSKSAPKRIDIAGHFAHFDDGSLKTNGSYWSTHEDIQLTISRIKTLAQSGEIKHLLFYAHGGLNSPKASAKRIKAMKDGFKRNKIYPFHMMYDTGLAEELMDLIKKNFTLSGGMISFFKEKIADFADSSDKLLEKKLRSMGTALWEEMKTGAHRPFEQAHSDGVKVISEFIKELKDEGIQFHLAGHSTGGILMGHLLEGIKNIAPTKFETCSLLAPACTIDFYKSHFLPRLKRNPQNDSLIKNLLLYNLSEKLELDDNVILAYRKSLLYLVSNSFERVNPKPLLGMYKFAKKLKDSHLTKYESTGKGNITRSTSHGGFDNDKYTMNNVLKKILGADPEKPFSESELDY